MDSLRWDGSDPGSEALGNCGEGQQKTYGSTGQRGYEDPILISHTVPQDATV